MFDTMTVTKVAGALIGALLFLLLVNWAGSAIYSVGEASHGGEGEEHAQAYTIPVPESGEGGAAKEEVEIDFVALMDAADPAAGEKIFAKCKACHKVDGSNGIGPHLNGVVGRDVASVGGFGYSDAMLAHATEAPQWTPEALQEFLTDPRGVVSGTKMSFAGLDKPEDRANLIAYLQTTE